MQIVQAAAGSVQLAAARSRTYVIWGQFTAVEREILKESGALKDLIVFSRRFIHPSRQFGPGPRHDPARRISV